MKSMRLCGTAALAFGAVCASFAQYNFDLYLRTGDAGGYNLGGLNANNGINSATPTFNAQGQLAIRGLNTSGSWGYWTGTSTAGSGTFATVGGEPIGEPSINNSGRILFSRSDAAGVWQLQYGSSTISQLTAGPSGASSWTAIDSLHNGFVGMKTNLNGNSYQVYNPATNTFVTPVSQNGNYTFVFSSVQFNEALQMAAPVQPLSGGTEIRRWNLDGTSVTVAQDRTINTSSNFTGFFNNLGFSENGMVAFNAALNGGGRGVFLWNGTNTVEIANTNNTGGVYGTAESFNMVVSNSGTVFFRGRDRQGKYAIFSGDGGNVTTILKQGDIIQTDLGAAMIGGTSTNPSFGGSLAVNSLGQLAFTAQLFNPNNPSQFIGTGVFTATPVPEPATLAALGLGAAAIMRRRRRK